MTGSNSTYRTLSVRSPENLAPDLGLARVLLGVIKRLDGDMYVPAETVFRPSKLGNLFGPGLASRAAPWNPQQTVFFDSGKSALWGAFRALDLKSGDRILAPAYVFHGVIQPALSLGLKCDYYGIGDRLEPDLQELVDQIDDRTKAILVVHYFGFPGPVAALRSICDQRHIALVEDCAHAMFGQTAGRPLGSFGEVSAFSFKKAMAAPGGGMLAVNHPTLRFQEPLRPPPLSFTLKLLGLRAWNSGESALGFSLKAALLGSHDFRRRLARRGKPSAQGYCRRLSALSTFFAKFTDPDEAIACRRANYVFLQQELKSFEWLEPVFPSLPDGTAPFCFPVYSRDRDAVQDHLLRHGVHARVYWDLSELPPGALARYPQLSKLLDRMLILPAHQDVGRRQLEHIVGTLRSFPQK